MVCHRFTIYGLTCPGRKYDLLPWKNDPIFIFMYKIELYQQNNNNSMIFNWLFSHNCLIVLRLDYIWVEINNTVWGIIYYVLIVSIYYINSKCSFKLQYLPDYVQHLLNIIIFNN